MKNKNVILLTIFLFLGYVNSGCRVAESPPPGWDSPIGDLILDETAFPPGWQVDFTSPDDALTDPKINHFATEWWNPSEGSAGIMQSIWRGYSISDAKEKYRELRQSSLLAGQLTPSSSDYYVEFVQPQEIHFISSIADDFYLACGWMNWAFCVFVSRYKNYVVYMQLDLETEYDGQVWGLSYSEIEAAILKIDEKFASFFAILYPSDFTP